MPVYVWREGEVVEVDRKVQALPDVYVPQGGYVDESLGSFKNGKWQPARVESREQKARLMRENNVVEDGGWKHNPRRKYFV